MKKRKNRHNPKIDEIPLTYKEISYLKNHLVQVLAFGYLNDLAKIFKLLKIGYKCTDCDNEYELCGCEYCNDCNSIECLCHYEFDKVDKIREVAWNLSKELFDKKDLLEIKNYVLLRIKNNQWLLSHLIKLMD